MTAGVVRLIKPARPIFIHVYGLLKQQTQLLVDTLGVIYYYDATGDNYIQFKCKNYYDDNIKCQCSVKLYWLEYLQFWDSEKK